MKDKKNNIADFINLKSFALLGASAKKKKFGNEILKQMSARGCKVYPVHKTAEEIDGFKCYKDLNSLPGKPEGVILVIPPAETMNVIRDIAKLGIKNVWLQQGAESKEAVEFCVSKGINVIAKECMLMYLSNMGFPHNFHKWVHNLGSRH